MLGRVPRARPRRRRDGRSSIPIVSTVTGAWATDEQLADPDYWATHLRQTVRFSDAAGVLLDQPDMILLEVGPGQTLTSLARQHPQQRRTGSSSRRSAIRASRSSDEETMLRALGQIWAAGGTSTGPPSTAAGGRWWPCPTYPFDHERYWIDPARRPSRRARRAAPAGRRDRSPRRRMAALPPGRFAASLDARPPSCAAGRDIAGCDGAPPGRIAPGPDRRAAGVDPERPERHRAAALDPTASFADLGFDSLFLTQANAQFRKQFGVRITFRQIFEEAPSIDSLAGFIDAQACRRTRSRRPNSARPSSAPTSGGRREPAPLSGGRREHAARSAGRRRRARQTGAGSSAVERLIREQLRIMEQQLELMRRSARCRGPDLEPRQRARRRRRRDRATGHPGARAFRGRAARGRRPPARANGPLPRDARPGPPPPASRDLTEASKPRSTALVRRADARTPGIEAARAAVAAPPRRQPGDRRLRPGVEGARLPGRRPSARAGRGSGTSTATSTSTRRSASGRTCSATRRTSSSTPCASSSTAASRSASRATCWARSARWHAR